MMLDLTHWYWSLPFTFLFEVLKKCSKIYFLIPKIHQHKAKPEKNVLNEYWSKVHRFIRKREIKKIKKLWFSPWSFFLHLSWFLSGSLIKSRLGFRAHELLFTCVHFWNDKPAAYHNTNSILKSVGCIHGIWDHLEEANTIFFSIDKLLLHEVIG